MNFDLTEDQAMLKDTAERLFAEGSEGLWPRLAELGLLAAPFAEEDGGLGLGPIETMIVGEAAGRAQVVSAYAGAIATAGAALRLAEIRPTDQIAALAAGETVFAWAHEEAGRGPNASRGVTAKAAGDGWLLSGVKSDVAWATAEAALVVTATLEGEPALFVVDADAMGASLRDYRLFDETPVAEVTLKDALAEVLLARGEAAALLIARAREHQVAYRAAEAVGLMQAMLDATVEHLKTRKQFGETLSSFQALRHKASEMLVSLEQSRSMAMLAALSVDEADANARAHAISQVRAVVGKASRFVAQTAVQLHGGIGVTEEHPVGRGFRRLTLIDLEMERG
jgi:alkylation response protein AidB-like acyl-CoA dehydrogenase